MDAKLKEVHEYLDKILLGCQKSLRFNKSPEDEKKCEDEFVNGLEKIVYDSEKEYDDEEMKHIKYIIFQSMQSNFSVHLIYEHSCCKQQQAVMLDRYPMSEKIICVKCDCGKYGELTILRPITFWDPLLKMNISMEDLSNSHITDTRQKHFLELYRDFGDLNG